MWSLEKMVKKRYNYYRKYVYQKQWAGIQFSDCGDIFWLLERWRRRESASHLAL